MISGIEFIFYSDNNLSQNWSPKIIHDPAQFVGCSCKIVKKALPLTYEFLKLRRGKSFPDAFEKQGMLRQKTWMNAENNKICQFIIVIGIGLYLLK